MAETYEIAEKDYVKGMKYKEIAEKYGVSLNTVKSWKQRYGWSRKKGAHKEKSMHTKNNGGILSKKKQQVLEEPFVESGELTVKQRDFCTYYVKYRNKTKAYMKAYECSWKTANAHAYRLWENEGVREEIDRQLKELRDEIKLDTQDILQKYIDIAFADITDFIDFTQVESEATETDVEFNPDGSKKSEKTSVVPYTYTKFTMHHSEEVDGTLITELSKSKDGMFKVKLADKMKALEFLTKYTDLLSENDRKRLQEEKLKAEIDGLRGNTNKEGAETWVDALKAVAEKRKQMKQDE